MVVCQITICWSALWTPVYIHATFILHIPFRCPDSNTYQGIQVDVNDAKVLDAVLSANFVCLRSILVFAFQPLLSQETIMDAARIPRRCTDEFRHHDDFPKMC